MVARTWKVGLALLVAGAGLWRTPTLCGQPAEPPPLPQGVEVQARGPIHEAFASLTAEPEASKPIAKQPPKPLDEMAPEEKPEGEVVWIGGYWAFDEERNDFLWVSGTWRTVPPGRTWVGGYWREDSSTWRWVAGFWAAAPKDETAASHEVAYLPQPPAPPEVAPPPKPTEIEAFYVPGTWVWDGTKYAFKAGYWAKVEPGYVWINAHYRWTPSGYIYVNGYWDLAISRRGILYAPVFITPGVVTVGFRYTPYYAVRDTVVLDSLFVRPCYCHYYFGDYYGPAYRDYGFETCVVYSRRRYDSIIVYESYQRRNDPAWLTVQINLSNDRYYGRAAVPPRTLVAQANVGGNVRLAYAGPVLASPAVVARERGVAVVRLDITTRTQAVHQAANVQLIATQRAHAEVPLRPGEVARGRVTTLTVVKTETVKPGFVAKAVVTTPTVHPATAPAATAPKPGTPTTHPPLTSTHPATGTPPAKTGMPPGTHPPTTGSLPPGTHPPGTGTGPLGTHPPGTGTTPPGTHPPGTGTLPPGSKPPTTTPPATGTKPGTPADDKTKDPRGGQ